MTSGICRSTIYDLFASVKGRAERSRTRTVESAAIRVEAHRDNPEKLGLVLPGADEPIAPTHWSFGQLSSLVGAPATYLRQLPAPLAGINLQYGLTNHRAEQIKTLEIGDGRTELRAVTGPDYGRIYDHELVSAVQRIAGNGTGDTRWKVPGVLDWSTGIYNPRVDVTKDTTTLYASDRDVFLFLVDDLNPIEAGLLPDLYFRGVLLLEFRGGRQDAGHRQLLPARGLPELQSLGRRGFPEDQNPPLEICRVPLCACGGPGAHPLCQLLARTLHRRHLLALRTLDARRDSASYQQIAQHLFGADAVSREHWKTSSLKAQIIDNAERAWALDWLASLLAREGVTIDPAARDHLWSALTSLSSAPVEERTLTGLSVLLQSTELKRALAPFCLGGPFGRLLDAETEELGSADVLAFETEGLIGSAAAPAVLAYLFHRIEARLDGRPTMVVIDEGCPSDEDHRR